MLRPAPAARQAGPRSTRMRDAGAAPVIGGVAVGLIFRGGLSELNRVAEPQHRAAVVSTYFVAGYVGLGLPAVLIGLLSVPVGSVDASGYVSGLVAAVVVAALTVGLRAFGSTPAPRPASAPSDSWCCPEELADAGAAAGRPPGRAGPRGR
jgi:hypothetical protein